MRGILLVVVGAILIGLGFFGSSGDDDPQRSDAGERNARREAGATPGVGSAAGADMDRPTRREPDRDPPPEVEADPDPVASAPPAAPEPDPVPAREPVRVGGTPAHAPSSTPGGAPSAELASRSEAELWGGQLDGDGARDGSAPQDDDPVFELAGVEKDRGALGRCLLESWLARDPSELQAALEEGRAEGILPPGRQQLVVAFWGAMAGNAEAFATAVQDLKGQDGVHSSQLHLLGLALDPDGPHAIAASAGRNDALGHAMRMVLLEEEAARARRDGQVARAAAAWSELMHAELEATWWAPHRAHLLEWAAFLREAQRSHRLSKKGDWPSHDVKVLPGDVLSKLRQDVVRENPDLLVCVGLLERVNELGRYLQQGQTLRFPRDVPNVLVDLDARLVVYRHGGEAVLAWPCGIGREGHDTPTGNFQVGIKLEDPVWYPGDGRAIPPGTPENLLGKRWIEWDLEGEGTSFGFHGTNQPDGVGERVSSGCIRMLNEDVIELFELLPEGATVQVQP